MSEIVPYANKMKTHDAIIDSLRRAEDYLEHGSNIIENIREFSENNSPPLAAAGPIIEMCSIMKAEYEPAWQAVCKVEEWLTRAHTGLAIRQECDPVIDGGYASFFNLHHAFLDEMSFLPIDIEEACGLRIPTIELLSSNLGELTKWCDKLPPEEISKRICEMRIECYEAVGISEASIRTDIDQESNSDTIAASIRPKSARKSPEKKRLVTADDQKLFKCLDETGKNYSAAVERGLVPTENAASKRVSRAKMKYTAEVLKSFPTLFNGES